MCQPRSPVVRLTSNLHLRLPSVIRNPQSLLSPRLFASLLDSRYLAKAPGEDAARHIDRICAMRLSCQFGWDIRNAWLRQTLYVMCGLTMWQFRHRERMLSKSYLTFSWNSISIAQHVL